MRYPATSCDVFNQAASVAKDRFLATARLVRSGTTYVFDIQACPAIAVNQKIVDDLGEVPTKIMTRKDFFDVRPPEYADVHQLVAGTYLWLDGKMSVLQRTGNVAASGLLTNPSGVCDGLPSRTMDDELVEESALTWYGNGALVVPVLCNTFDSGHEIERKMTMKEAQRDMFARVADKQGITVTGITFEPLRVQPRLQDQALPSFAKVEVRQGDIVWDKIETPVHLHFTPEWNAWNMHRSCSAEAPRHKDILLMDGEGFGRPGFLKSPEELAAPDAPVLGFLRDYARDVLKASL